jgi:hypothetical protein
VVGRDRFSVARRDGVTAVSMVVRSGTVKPGTDRVHGKAMAASRCPVREAAQWRRYCE